MAGKKFNRKSPKLASESGFIYLIRCNEFHKVGRAVCVQSRLSSLQTSSPYPLELIDSFKTLNSAGDERAMHRYLKAYRVQGEWFNVPADVLAARDQWFKPTATTQKKKSLPLAEPEPAYHEWIHLYGGWDGYEVWADEFVEKTPYALRYAMENPEQIIERMVDGNDDFLLIRFARMIWGIDYYNPRCFEQDFINCIRRYRVKMSWRGALLAAIHTYHVEPDPVAAVLREIRFIRPAVVDDQDLANLRSNEYFFASRVTRAIQDGSDPIEAIKRIRSTFGDRLTIPRSQRDPHTPDPLAQADPITPPTHRISIGGQVVSIAMEGRNCLMMSVADIHALSGIPITEIQQKICEQCLDSENFGGGDWQDFLDEKAGNPATYSEAPIYIAADIIGERNSAAAEIIHSLESHPDLLTSIPSDESDFAKS